VAHLPVWFDLAPNIAPALLGKEIECLDRDHAHNGMVIPRKPLGFSMRFGFLSRDRATHFLMRTLPKVATEMALHVLAYNMKRVKRILGVGGLMDAMIA
jgi:hypothetical protein